MNKKGDLYMRRIFFIFLFLLFISDCCYAAFIEKIGIIEDTNKKLKFLIKSKITSYKAFMLSRHYPKLVLDIKGTFIKRGYKKRLRPKGGIISCIYVGNRKRGARIVFISKRRLGFKYRVEQKEEYLIVTCWPKSKRKIIKGKYLPIPKPRKGSIKGLLKTASEGPEGIGIAKIPTYTGQRISLDFYKADLHNVFRLFAEISGKNFIVSDKVKGTITMTLKNVPWDFALDLILEVENLKKEEMLNTYIIKPIEKKEKGKGELIVRKVPEKTIHLARLLKKKEENIRRAERLIKKAYDLEKKKKIKDALKFYEEATELWEDNIDLMKKTAYLYYKTGSYARAYYFANRALKLNPNDSEAALYGALSAIKLSKNKDANILFDMAIKGEPKLPEAYYDYALFLEKEKDYIHALALYEEYEDMFGPILQTSLSIAELYSKLGNKKEACRKYKEIMAAGFNISPFMKKEMNEKIKQYCIER